MAISIPEVIINGKELEKGHWILFKPEEVKKRLKQGIECFPVVRLKSMDGGVISLDVCSTYPDGKTSDRIRTCVKTKDHIVCWFNDPKEAEILSKGFRHASEIITEELRKIASP